MDDRMHMSMIGCGRVHAQARGCVVGVMGVWVMGLGMQVAFWAWIMPLVLEANPRTPSLIKEYRARHGPSPGSLRDSFIVGSSLKWSRDPMRTSSGATSSPLWARTSRAPRWPRDSASRTTTSEFWARGIPDGFPAEPPIRTKTDAESRGPLRVRMYRAPR